MVHEVQYDYVREHSGYRKGWSLTVGAKKSVDLLFEFQDIQLPEGMDQADYLENVQRSNTLPHGVHQVLSLDNERFFRITCDVDAQDAARKCAKEIFLWADS